MGVTGFLFTFDSAAVAAIIVGVVIAAMVIGVVLGRRFRDESPHLHGSIDVVQGALFGMIGLLLAFGLSLALDRYEERRAAIVAEANAIGQVIDTAELLPEPVRSQTAELVDRYVRASIGLSNVVVGSSRFDELDAEMSELYSEMWAIGGEVAVNDPESTVAELHLLALSDASGTHTERLESLENRVPDEITGLLLLVVLLSVGSLAMHLTVVGRGILSSLAAATVVALILLALLDLDRPNRGLITVPDTALVALLS
jgi:hypothetical protein